MDFGDAVSQSGGLETVRALHQTIVALRAALEQSKSEILELKSKAWPIESVQDVIQALSIENHVLRQQITDTSWESPKKSFVTDDNKEVSKEFIFNAQEVEDYNQSPNENAKKKIDKVDSLINSQEDLNKPNLFNKHASIADSQEEQYLALGASDQHQLTDESNKPNIKKNPDLPASKIPNNTNREEKTDGQSPKRLNKLPKSKKVTIASPHLSPRRHYQLETRIFLTAKKRGIDNSTCKSLESLTVVKSPLDKELSFTKTVSFSNLTSVSREFKFSQNIDETTMTDQSSNTKERQNSDEGAQNQYDEQLSSPQNDMDQEVDDIELIFTTDDTKDQEFKEELVPIDTRESNSNLLNLALSDIDQISDRELDDDVFNDTVDESNQDNTHNYHQSSFEMKRDNSIFNSRSDNSINHEKSLKSYYSYQDSSFENKSLEKDESFDRFDERVRIVETDISKCGIHEVEYVVGRRNTCPNPIQYRPLQHRDAISKGLGSRKTRPILTHSNASRRESGAQTDISALPGSSWRSESSLANKAKLGENFTTLPSKYPMPGSRLRLSEKTTVEARRVLLSDIGFTSMVPELSRSADHLFPGALKPPTVTSYGQFLKATDLYSPGCMSQKFTWAATTATPSESSQTQSRYSSIYPLSPPAPSRRCSAPVSPSRRALLKSTASKVRFANGSLPELRTDWTTVDSGDSTDSLVEEAENYLRRSIDCFVTNKETSLYGDTRKTVPPRRASAPEPARDNVPPQGWQPFLPRLPRDLKLDNWVKVITPEGRVRGGRVRYVGPVVTQAQEQFVGVQLTCPEGISDGTYGGRRYFQCEPYHGIFVPFKKVIMGWQP